MDTSEEHEPAADRPGDADELAQSLERLGAAVVEVAETVVGLGVLGINRLQALRRDLAERAGGRPDSGSGDPG